MKKKRVLVLLSGKGSNLRQLIRSADFYEISAVFSDQESAPGLQIALKQGIPTACFPRQKFSDIHEQKTALYQRIESEAPDLVALAGFMQLLRPDFVEKFYGKILNIHPSLLPKYPGLSTHSRAIEAGEAYHGCTVHFVDCGMDTGPIIAQARCSILREDSPSSLQARVQDLEHLLYPKVLNSLANDEFSLKDKKVIFEQGAARSFTEDGFILPEEI